MLPLSALIDKAIIAASTLTGKKFGLLVASSVVATSAVVASAVTNPEGGISPLAALLGRSLASESAPAEAPVEEEAPAAESSPSPSSGPAESSSTPISSSPAPAPAPAPEPQEEPVEEPAPEETAPVGPVKHLFVVSLVSPGYEAAFGETSSQMPYLSTELRPQGQLLSGYSLLSENAAPNGIASISGQKPTAASRSDCPSFDDCVFPVETYTVADQLTVGKRSWAAYYEDMADTEGKPDNCVYPAAEEEYAAPEGGYAPQRNPFVFFHSLLDLGDCALNDKPLTELAAALKAKPEKAPTVTWITPNLCNSGSTSECPEGRSGGPAAADAFLGEWGKKILASPAYKDDGMLIVTFDQVDPVPVEAATPASGEEALKVGTLLVSRFLSPGSEDPKPYDPYSTLRSTEELFGLGYLPTPEVKKAKSYVKPLFGSESGD